MRLFDFEVTVAGRTPDNATDEYTEVRHFVGFESLTNATVQFSTTDECAIAIGTRLDGDLGWFREEAINTSGADNRRFTVSTQTAEQVRVKVINHADDPTDVRLVAVV